MIEEMVSVRYQGALRPMTYDAQICKNTLIFQCGIAVDVAWVDRNKCL